MSVIEGKFQEYLKDQFFRKMEDISNCLTYKDFVYNLSRCISCDSTYAKAYSCISNSQCPVCYLETWCNYFPASQIRVRDSFGDGALDELGYHLAFKKED